MAAAAEILNVAILVYCYGTEPYLRFSCEKNVTIKLAIVEGRHFLALLHPECKLVPSFAEEGKIVSSQYPRDIARCDWMISRLIKDDGERRSDVTIEKQ